MTEVIALTLAALLAVSMLANVALVMALGRVGRYLRDCQETGKLP